MKTDSDPRTTAELAAEVTRLCADKLWFLAVAFGDKTVSMTDATQALWGESGRGHPRAVRIIETLGEYGYLSITGNKRRRVTFTEKGRELLSGPSRPFQFKQEAE